MKKLLFLFASLAVLLCASCKTEQDVPSKTIIIENFPEHVSLVQILGGDSILDCTDGDISEKITNVHDNITININYDYSGDRKKYVLFGNLTSDVNPFKVFVNDVEMENMYPVHKTDCDNHLETNLIDSFSTTFASDSVNDTLVITYENAPRLISYDEIHLVDETIYSYFDVSGVGEYLRCELYEQLAGNSNISLTPVIYGKLFYVNKYSDVIKLNIIPENGYGLRNSSIFADGEEIIDSVLDDNWFTYTFNGKREKGQVIKITGASAYLIDDSDFRGGEFSSISIASNSPEAPDIGEVGLYFNNDRSVTMLVADKFIDNCYWFMEADDTCLIQYPVSEDTWHSASIYKRSDGKYEFFLDYAKRGTVYSYAVMLEKNR